MTEENPSVRIGGCRELNNLASILFSKLCSLNHTKRILSRKYLFRVLSSFPHFIYRIIYRKHYLGLFHYQLSILSFLSRYSIILYFDLSYIFPHFALLSYLSISIFLLIFIYGTEGFSILCTWPVAARQVQQVKLYFTDYFSMHSLNTQHIINRYW